MVRALALRSGDLAFKTSSDHSLNLFLLVPVQLDLLRANWFASGQLEFLTAVFVASLILFHWP